ncbi:COX15/CtaA family protein [Vannielia litorea]|uniref:heme A synthase n=1 Tax=Vannielia litorea TaxID=1217970 RepID=UPI001C98E0EA|nr:heme A synthase [Vannielia litorea]MBY6152647.1 COX15/CtaA family protein [Vannielia litorea]
MAGKRSIFEEVGEGEAPRSAPRETGLIDKGSRSGARLTIRSWLVLLFALVVVMILVGGLTRLTDSGLSITEWNVVKGAIPPLNEADWNLAFDKYKTIPEYELQNKGMSLAEFKTIYWWEWGHRQLGRLIGLVWAVGYLYFLLRGQIPTGWKARLLIPGVLGGIQGSIGWWMVHSGLSGEMTDVASYRLATHLGLAFAILGLLAWYVLLLSRPEREIMQARRARERRIFGLGTGLMHFAFLQILIGALVAGIDAGRNYIDWPLMAGGFTPPGMWEITPLWRNFFENDGTVQFIHRMVAYALFAFGLFAWVRSRRSAYAATRRAFDWAMVLLFGQVVLGIVTVMHSAPWHIAITHQALGVALWVVIIRARFLAGYPKAGTLREGL